MLRAKDLAQEQRQVTVKEKLTEIVVTVAREDFPLQKTKVSVSFYPSSAQEAWGKFLADVTKGLKLDFIHSIVDRGDKAPIYRIIMLKHNAEYLVRQRENSAVLEVLNTSITPMEISWEVTRDIMHVKKDLEFNLRTNPITQDRVYNLVTKPITSLQQKRFTERLLSTTKPKDIVDDVNKLYLPGLETWSPEYMTGLTSLNYNETGRLELEFDMVTIHRLSLEQLDRLCSQGFEALVAKQAIHYVFKVMSDMVQECDVVAIALKLTADLAVFLLKQRDGVFTAVLNAMQFYAPKAPQHRPRKPKRLAMTMDISSMNRNQSQNNSTVSYDLTGMFVDPAAFEADAVHTNSNSKATASQQKTGVRPKSVGIQDATHYDDVVEKIFAKRSQQVQATRMKLMSQPPSDLFQLSRYGEFYASDADRSHLRGITSKAIGYAQRIDFEPDSLRPVTPKMRKAMEVAEAQRIQMEKDAEAQRKKLEKMQRDLELAEQNRPKVILQQRDRVDISASKAAIRHAQEADSTVHHQLPLTTPTLLGGVSLPELRNTNGGVLSAPPIYASSSSPGLSHSQHRKHMPDTKSKTGTPGFGHGTRIREGENNDDEGEETDNDEEEDDDEEENDDDEDSSKDKLPPILLKTSKGSSLSGGLPFLLKKNSASMKQESEEKKVTSGSAVDTKKTIEDKSVMFKDLKESLQQPLKKKKKAIVHIHKRSNKTGSEGKEQQEDPGPVTWSGTRGNVGKRFDPLASPPKPSPTAGSSSAAGGGVNFKLGEAVLSNEVPNRGKNALSSSTETSDKPNPLADTDTSTSNKSSQLQTSDAKELTSLVILEGENEEEEDDGEEDENEGDRNKAKNNGNKPSGARGDDHSVTSASVTSTLASSPADLLVQTNFPSNPDSNTNSNTNDIGNNNDESNPRVVSSSNNTNWGPSIATLIKRAKKMKFVKQPLPPAPRATFRGFDKQMPINLVLTAAFAAVLQLLLVNYGNREWAFSHGLLDEVAEVILDCAAMPKLLEYFVEIVEILFREGLGDPTDRTQIDDIDRTDQFDAQADTASFLSAMVSDTGIDSLQPDSHLDSVIGSTDIDDHRLENNHIASNRNSLRTIVQENSLAISGISSELSASLAIESSVYRPSKMLEAMKMTTNKKTEKAEHTDIEEDDEDYEEEVENDDELCDDRHSQASKDEKRVKKKMKKNKEILTGHVLDTMSELSLPTVDAELIWSQVHQQEAARLAEIGSLHGSSSNPDSLFNAATAKKNQPLYNRLNAVKDEDDEDENEEDEGENNSNSQNENDLHQTSSMFPEMNEIVIQKLNDDDSARSLAALASSDGGEKIQMNQNHAPINASSGSKADASAMSSLAGDRSRRLTGQSQFPQNASSAAGRPSFMSQNSSTSHPKVPPPPTSPSMTPFSTQSKRFTATGDTKQQSRPSLRSRADSNGGGTGAGNNRLSTVSTAASSTAARGAGSQRSITSSIHHKFQQQQQEESGYRLFVKSTLRDRLGRNKELVQTLGLSEFDARYRQTPEDSVIAALSLTMNHVEVSSRFRELAGFWLEFWADGSREYKLMLIKGRNLCGL